MANLSHEDRAFIMSQAWIAWTSGARRATTEGYLFVKHWAIAEELDKDDVAEFYFDCLQALKIGKLYSSFLEASLIGDWDTIDNAQAIAARAMRAIPFIADENLRNAHRERALKIVGA